MALGGREARAQIWRGRGGAGVAWLIEWVIVDDLVLSFPRSRDLRTCIDIMMDHEKRKHAHRRYKYRHNSPLKVRILPSPGK